MAPQGQPTGFRPTPQQLARMAAIDDVGARVAGVLAPFAEKPQPVPEKIRMMRQFGFPETKKAIGSLKNLAGRRRTLERLTSKITRQRAKAVFRGRFTITNWPSKRQVVPLALSRLTHLCRQANKRRRIS
jgi:hypothetical protein